MRQATRHRRTLALATASAVLTAGLVGAAGPAGANGSTVPYTVMLNNFETTVGGNAPGWSALDVDGASETPASTTFSTTDVRTRTSHARSLEVRNRDAAGDGAQMTIPATLLTAGQTYTISAWVYVPDSATKIDDASDIEARVLAGSTDLAPLADTDLVITPGTFKNVQVTYTHDAANTTLSIAVGNTLSTFFIDDVHIQGTRAGTPITVDATLKDTLDYPIGVAIEGRSTIEGTQAEEVLSREFDSATPENAMKPESWYGPDNKFAGTEGAVLENNAGADAIMDWAVANDARVYGHVLVWHSQVPSWFFQKEGGGNLTNAPEDQDVLKERLRTHIFNIAEYLSDRYGEFGSETNPLQAFDVVNEVVADNTAAASNGLRTSQWYNILGEEFIDLSFQYADEAFNDLYAAEDADRPVKLFINEYGTEGGDGAGTKLQRYYDLVERLLERDVPVDGIGNQFHVQLTRDVENLRIAMDKQADFGLLSAVTEFDVTTGYPASERLLIQQGHYYQQAFDIFNEYAAEHPGKLWSVTVWGLHDAGSWLYYSGAPTMFDDFYRPKWSLVGALGGELPDIPKSLSVFGGTVDLTPAATTDLSWDLVPHSPIGEVGEIALLWASDHLTAYVAVEDATVEETDAIEFSVRDETYTLTRAGEGTADGVVTETDTGWVAVAHLPITGVAAGNSVPFTFSVTDGETTTGWNSPGIMGELRLQGTLRSVAVVEAPSAPEIDAEIDDVWAEATTVTTGNAVQGTDTATAEVRTLWSGDGSTLYVLMEVTDPVINVSASNPWEQDSVEIFVDPGNAKNGSYRAADTQIRISATNVRSYGTGNATDQAARVASAVTETDDGYIVEASVDLLTFGGPGTVHGLDFQVNDSNASGVRIGVRSWADATGNGYATTANWGVGKFVEADDPEVPEVPSFSDVPENHPFYEEITWLATEGITTGFSDGTFRGIAPIERQAMAAFLYRYAGEPAFTPPTTSPFTDVNASDPFYTEITWLADQGITTGFSDGTFRPSASIERQAMAAFLYRFAGEPEFTAPQTSPFTDVRPADRFYTEITWLADIEVTTGFSDGTFRPVAPIERQAMAAFLFRFDDLMK